MGQYAGVEPKAFAAALVIASERFDSLCGTQHEAIGPQKILIQKLSIGYHLIKMNDNK